MLWRFDIRALCCGDDRTSWMRELWPTPWSWCWPGGNATWRSHLTTRMRTSWLTPFTSGTTTTPWLRSLTVSWKCGGSSTTCSRPSVVSASTPAFNPSTPTVAVCVYSYKAFLTSGHSDAHGWASECPDVKNYKLRLNRVWQRMLYSYTHMAPLGVSRLTTSLSCSLQHLVGCLADPSNGLAHDTVLCLSVCRLSSVTYAPWLNGASYRKTVRRSK